MANEDTSAEEAGTRLTCEFKLPESANLKVPHISVPVSADPCRSLVTTTLSWNFQYGSCYQPVSHCEPRLFESGTASSFNPQCS